MQMRRNVDVHMLMRPVLASLQFYKCLVLTVGEKPKLQQRHHAGKVMVTRNLSIVA